MNKILKFFIKNLIRRIHYIAIKYKYSILIVSEESAVYYEINLMQK